MRKTWIFMLTLLLGISMLPSVSIGATEAKLSLHASSESAKLGETVTITLQAESLIDLFASDIRLSYDPDLLEYKESISEFTAGFPFSKESDGSLLLGHTFTSKVPGLSGDHKLYTITFVAKSEGTASIRLSDATLISYENEKQVTRSWTAAHATVELGSKDQPEPQPEIRVTGVTLDHGGLQLKIGDSASLVATVAPADATNKAVNWTSSRSDVATVSASGVVTAVAAGASTITATTVDGGKTASSTVSVTSGTTETASPSDGTGSGQGPVDPGQALVPADAHIRAEAKLNPDGSAVAVISSERLGMAIAGSKDRSISIAVVPLEGAANLKVRLPAGPLFAHGKPVMDLIHIDTGHAKLWIQTKLLLKAGRKTDGALLELAVARADGSELPADVRTKPGGRPVYEFGLTLDSQSLSLFADQEIAVELPYVLGAGEKPGQVVVYFLPEGNELEVVKNGRYHAKPGRVAFKPKHFSRYAAAYAQADFIDLAGVPWAQDAIQALAARQVVQGMGDGLFQPDGSVTRAEFVTMLVNALDLAEDQAVTSFSDVEQGAWYYRSVASAQKLGIVNGKTDALFGVSDTITRQDMAVMMHRAVQALSLRLSSVKPGATFADQAAISSYAEEAVTAMRQAGIVEGMEQGLFAPLQHTTRAQAAMMIFRLMDV